MEKLGRRLAARLGEPSSWAAIAAVLAIAGINVPADWAGEMASAVRAGVGAAAVVAAGLGVFIGEKGNDR